MYLNTILQKYFLIISTIIITISFGYSSFLYSGNKLIFFLFFLSVHLYLIIAFFFSNLFFDKVLSTFLWLGFYLTIFFKIIFKAYSIKEGDGNFEYLPDQFNKVLIWSSVAILAFTSSSLFHKFLIKIKNLDDKDNFKLTNFYKKYRYEILFLFFILIVSVNFSNFKFELYQKGLMPLHQIPPLLSMVLKFFVIFGLTGISTILIDYEIKSKNKLTFLILLIFYFEIITTNTVLLSRSYIFLGGFILFSILISYKVKKENSNYFNSFLFNIIIFILLFLINIQVINNIRASKYFDPEFFYSKRVDKINEKKYESIKEFYIFNQYTKKLDLNKKIIENTKSLSKKNIEIVNNAKKSLERKIKEIQESKNISYKKKFYNNLKDISYLIQNRFIGFESLAIVTSSNRQNADTFWNSFQEKITYQPKESYYAINLMNTGAKNLEPGSTRQYSVFLPGVIAFFSYYGSLIFLFTSLFLLHLFLGFIEKIALILSFNSKIFSSFVGFTLAYRLIHFGYVPKNSYMLLAAIFISIFGIFIISKFIKKYC
jgi:hypothetical protein